jgi:hypothetical protein
MATPEANPGISKPNRDDRETRRLSWHIQRVCDSYVGRSTGGRTGGRSIEQEGKSLQGSKRTICHNLQQGSSLNHQIEGMHWQNSILFHLYMAD